MRLSRLRLKNYIGIFNGMGLTEIDIPFYKCTSRLVIIKGDNGSGKSSIYNAMNPLNDNVSNILPEQPGEKLISYQLDDNSILEILYTYPVNKHGSRMPTKCSIVRKYYDGNEVQLNPSNNIQSGRDIIYDLLSLDDNFITLSELSANRKGLGGLKPFERKKYVNSIISSLEDYNTLYNLMTKKSIALKSMINSISTKLNQIGNIEMVKDMINKNTIELESIQDKYKTLNNIITYTNAKMDEIIKRNNGEDIEEKYKRLILDKAQIDKQFGDIDHKALKEYSEEELIMLEKEDSKLEATLSILENNMNDLISKEKDIRSEIDNLQIRLSSLKDEVVLKQYEDKLSTLNEQLSFYENCFKSIGFNEYLSISESEYDIAINAIDTINSHILSLGDEFPLFIVEQACTYIINPKNMASLSNIERELEVMKSNLKDLETKLSNSISKELFESSNIDCDKVNQCPIVKVLLQKTFIPSDEYSKLEKSIKTISDYIVELEEEKDTLTRVYKCVDTIRSLISYIQNIYSIISKFPNTDKLSNTRSILQSIESILPINIDLSKYKEYRNYITCISSTKNDIESIQSEIDKIINSSTESMAIRERLKSLTVNLQELLDSKVTLSNQITNVSNDKLQLKLKLDKIRHDKQNILLYSELLKKSQEMEKTVLQLEQDRNEYNELMESCVSDTMECNTLSNNIQLLTKSIEENKYKIVLFDQYKKDYDEYSSLYNSVQQVRFYSSINGIQTKYMAVYMNDILKDTNQLLEILFNGSFSLQPFIINDNEFRIPCIDMEGNIRPDISLMSDSQVSMISMLISFALLHKASKHYNIIKLDEVDNNLDIVNRLQFSKLIYNILDILRFEQCIIISHNNELDLSNTDMIMLKITNDEYVRLLHDSGANIIYDYNTNNIGSMS